MNDPAHRWLFTPAAGVDVVVSAAELVARLRAGGGDRRRPRDAAAAARRRGGGDRDDDARPGAAIAGRSRAHELAVPDGVALTAVVREDRSCCRTAPARLRAGDVVVALCEPGREHVLHDLLTRD